MRNTNINIRQGKALIFVLFLSLYYQLPGIAQGTTITGMERISWEKVLPGVWKASLGEMQLNALDFTSGPKASAIAELGDMPFPFDQTETYHHKTPTRLGIRLPLDEQEKIYGLGLEFEGINRRKQVYTLKVDHYGGVKGYTHAPVPFYISSKGYGVLINSPQRVKIHVGIGNRKDSQLPPYVDRTTGGRNWAARPLSDAVEASAIGTGMEIYVFGGRSVLEVVQRYNLFCGGGVLPPKWGLGFWHRVHTQSSDKNVHKEIADFEKNNFPLDVIGLEPGWQNFAYPCSYDWDDTRFPNPTDFVKTLNDKGIKVNLWENPYVAPSSSMYPSIKPFTGSHTVWLGEVPDYTLPAAQKVLLHHHQKNHLDIGVSGYKFDEVDGYDFWLWPDHATFPSGHDAVEVRQLYGLILQHLFQNHLKAQNQRSYNLVRSSYIGASDKSSVIYSDYYQHKPYVTALTNASFTGLLWTPEIRSAKSAEEWIRRFQTVCFSPMMMLNAWASGTKPWSFSEVTDMVREVIILRKRLLPYLYTAFYDYQQKGIPPFRAMVLEPGFEDYEQLTSGKLDGENNPYAEQQRLEVTDQYMMGPSLLVAPVFTGEKSREVVLPQGKWYDFYTGQYVGDEETISIEASLEQIALFVKDGAIIPMIAQGEDLNDSTPKLEVRHYGTKTNSYLLYNDDGASYGFEKGEYTITELYVDRTTKGDLKGRWNFKTVNQGFGFDEIVWKWMTRSNK